MSAQSLSERISTIMADVLEIPGGRILPDASPETVDTWDSVHHLNLVLALEQEFNFQFQPEEMDQLKDFSHVLRIVASKTNSN